MIDGTDLDALNSAKYLYLRELSEPRDNSLRMVVQEAVVHRDGVTRAPLSDLPELTALLKDASPIESAGACRSFELTWNRYVAYLVAEECVGSCGAPPARLLAGDYFVCIRTPAFSNILRVILAAILRRHNTTS
jgi:hypothetical protein